MISVVPPRCFGWLARSWIALLLLRTKNRLPDPLRVERESVCSDYASLPGRLRS